MRRNSLFLGILGCFYWLNGCSQNDPEKPEQQARTLQPYPMHTLPLGVTIDSLQKILQGHSALFDPKIEKRLYRMIPLNGYAQQGYGAVDLQPDGKIKSYYWYTNLEALTPDQRKYYTASSAGSSISSVLDVLTKDLGAATRLEPYPDEQWHTWRNDTATINLTLQNKHITLTKTGPTPAGSINPEPFEPMPPVVKPSATSKKKVVAKKPGVKKRAVVPKKKIPVKKAPVKKKVVATKPR